MENLRLTLGRLEQPVMCEDAMTDKLQKTEGVAAVSLCACMGPMYGEPHCLCEMQRRGLKLNEDAREAEHARAKEQWAKLMESGKLFATETHNVERNRPERSEGPS